MTDLTKEQKEFIDNVKAAWGSNLNDRQQKAIDAFTAGFQSGQPYGIDDIKNAVVAINKGEKPPAPGTTIPNIPNDIHNQNISEANRTINEVKNVGKLFGFGKKKEQKKDETPQLDVAGIVDLAEKAGVGLVGELQAAAGMDKIIDKGDLKKLLDNPALRKSLGTMTATDLAKDDVDVIINKDATSGKYSITFDVKENGQDNKATVDLAQLGLKIAEGGALGLPVNTAINAIKKGVRSF